MTSTEFDRGFIVFDKSEKARRGLESLLTKFPDPAAYVEDWLSSDNEILLWVLAVVPEPCRVISIRHRDDLLIGALEEFATTLGSALTKTRIATGPLDPTFAKQLRQRWRSIGGVVSNELEIIRHELHHEVSRMELPSN